MATQNPIEQEGTYPLPEAQLDRFMFNIILDYPNINEELDVVKRTTTNIQPSVDVVFSGEEVSFYQNLVRKIPIADNVLEYAVNLVASTRPSKSNKIDLVREYISWGAGPRASQYLAIGAKCNAAINGKFSPDIEDVKMVIKPILRHRIIRNYKAEADGVTVDDIIEQLS